MAIEEDFTGLEKALQSFLAESLEKRTIQIFKETRTVGVQPHCCGVPFTFENRYFIFTAAHCLRGELMPSLLVRSSDNALTSLEMSSVKWVEETGHSEFDKIDIGVVEIINQELIDDLNLLHTFLKLSDLELFHSQISSNSVKVDMEYVMYGYPESKTKLINNPGKTWSILGLVYRCGLNNVGLKKIKKDGFVNHLFINRVNKGVSFEDNGVIKLPKFFGMSGSGLWIPRLRNNAKNSFEVKCVGIFYGVARDLYVFTEIKKVIGLIRKEFDIPRLPRLP